MENTDFISGQELHPLVLSLKELIKSRWDEFPNLQRSPLDPKHQLIEAKLEGEDLIINNQVLTCRGMRKLHLEVALLGKGLQILHCVFFPDPCFDLPIFGLDVVVGPLGVSAAIVDLSPVSAELPKSVVSDLERIVIPSFQQVRELPSWGTIFSPFVQFIRPSNANEEKWFYEMVDGYLKTVISALLIAIPETSSMASTIQRHKGQINYCQKQKLNDKTRRILEKAFNQSWANWYIEELLFDEPPLI